MKFSVFKNHIKSDLTTHGYNGVLSLPKIYLFNASFRLLLNYRIGNFLTPKLKSSSWLLKYYRYRMHTKRGCDISYKAQLGDNIKFPHPFGIVIGEGVIIGNKTKIWQNVTLGSHGKQAESQEYPIVGDNVKIFEKATIIGGVKIGNNVLIGSKALVNQDVPTNSIARGIPAKHFVS